MKCIIATVKSWNINNAFDLKEKFKTAHDIFIISKNEELTENFIKFMKPDFLFFPHWSWIIKKEIYSKNNCVVFHSADLPFGRGGSPIQNQIVKGIEETKISAIKVGEEIDAGDIYIKENLCLAGTCEEILIRASNIIFKKMIPQFLNEKLIPIKQKGKVWEFKRRKKEDSKILEFLPLEKIYDYIRMLDGEGYPKAFIDFGEYRLEFSRAALKNDNILADVVIKKRDD